MKKWVIIFMIPGILVILMLGGAWAYQHFALDQIMDKDGMENPDYDPSDDLIVLDGDATYADNEKLLQIIVGVWTSTDGRWEMAISREDENNGDNASVVLTLDGSTMLEDIVSFTYLQPGDGSSTEFTLNSRSLVDGDGTALGEIQDFYYEADTGNGRIVMDVAYENDNSETVEFRMNNEE